MKNSKYDFTLKGYEDLEISTQIIIRSAIEKKINVEILDKTSHFLKLSRGNKIEYIKEATKTSLDSYMAYLIMENKFVTKKILQEHHLETPQGGFFTQLPPALDYIRKNPQKNVIKPTTANFGLGISIIEENEDNKSISEKFELALQFSETVIIEEFAYGDEYRFLVLGDKTVAVCNRVPANVTGDGEKTVQQLVEEKNLDIRRGSGHTTPLEKIEISEEEIRILSKNGYNIESTLKKGETVYLRDTSNISTGGDSIDKTDEVDDYYKKIAVQAAQSVQAKICGVDLMITNPQKKNITIKF